METNAIVEGQVVPPSEEKYKVTDSGLEVFKPESLTFDEWKDMGLSLSRMHKATSFAFIFSIGDWLNLGEHKFGEMYSQALDITGLNYHTLTHYKYVALHVPKENRFSQLSFSHHVQVVSMESPVQVEKLREALSLELSVNDFREHLRVEARVVTFWCPYCKETHKLDIRDTKVARVCGKGLESSPGQSGVDSGGLDVA